MRRDVWREKLVEKLPAFDPEWPDEIKSKWFDVVATLWRASSESSCQ